MIRVRDIMSSGVITVTPETTVREAMEILTHHHVSGLPVVAGGRTIGLVSAADLLALAASLPASARARIAEPEGADLDEPPLSGEDRAPWGYFVDDWGTSSAELDQPVEVECGQRNVLEEHTVADAMTRLPLVTVTPDATVPEAAERMRRAGVHRVLVVDGDRLAGILSAFDVARAVADGRLTIRTTVSPRTSGHPPDAGLL